MDKTENTYIMTDEERGTLMRKRNLPSIKEEEKEEDSVLDDFIFQLCCMKNRTNK